MKRRYLYYAGLKCTACRTTYSNNGRLAIMLRTKDIKYDGGPVFGKVTVNLDDGLDLEPEYAYLDTNNCPGIEECMMESGLAAPTGMYCRSGYCRYPLYKFDLNRIPEVKI